MSVVLLNFSRAFPKHKRKTSMESNPKWNLLVRDWMILISKLLTKPTVQEVLNTQREPCPNLSFTQNRNTKIVITIWKYSRTILTSNKRYHLIHLLDLIQTRKSSSSMLMKWIDKWRKWKPGFWKLLIVRCKTLISKSLN
jgi:hypothetical protein